MDEWLAENTGLNRSAIPLRLETRHSVDYLVDTRHGSNTLFVAHYRVPVTTSYIHTIGGGSYVLYIKHVCKVALGKWQPTTTRQTRAL
jgi:hypothetical protein